MFYLFVYRTKNIEDSNYSYNSFIDIFLDNNYTDFKKQNII